MPTTEEERRVSERVAIRDDHDENVSDLGDDNFRSEVTDST